MTNTQTEDQLATKRPRIASGFVFKSVFGENENLMLELLELSLGTKIAKLVFVQSEREFDVLPNARAGRVDVFVVDEEGNRYDVEVQAESRGNELLRARHYQSLIDVTQLRKGTKPEELCHNVVLFICDFDPLGHGLRLYDCRMTCAQTGETVADGRRIVLLNAHGSGDQIPESLAAFLRLVAGQRVEGDPFVDRVNDMIDKYVADPKWMEDYMTFEDELEAARYNAEQRGIKKGIEQGIERGKMKVVAGLVRDGIFSAEEAAARYDINLNELMKHLL